MPVKSAVSYVSGPLQPHLLYSPYPPSNAAYMSDEGGAQSGKCYTTTFAVRRGAGDPALLPGPSPASVSMQRSPGSIPAARVCYGVTY